MRMGLLSVHGCGVLIQEAVSRVSEVRRGGNGMTQKRVLFDFELDFTNGGGLQGQDFRLDIEGDDISDEQLVEHLVNDMRLLMVGDVRILNKQIIVEPHKRIAAEQ